MYAQIHGGGGGQLQLVLMPPPSYLSKLGGGSAGGGGVLATRRGGLKRGGGAARDPLLPHAYLKGVCVCLGVWGYRGMHAIIAISRLCQEESLKGHTRTGPGRPPGAHISIKRSRGTLLHIWRQ